MFTGVSYYSLPESLHLRLVPPGICSAVFEYNDRSLVTRDLEFNRGAISSRSPQMVRGLVPR